MRQFRSLFLIIAFPLLAMLLVAQLATRAEARRGERLVLEPNTMAELTALLSSGDALHSALQKQDDEQIDASLRDIEIATKRTMAVSSRLKVYDRQHLMKVLEAIDANVGIARNSGHSERRDRISDIFNMMANLVRVYGVDTSFKIFFCGRDKVTWIQRKPAGQYPFVESAERNCALRAP